MVPDPSQPEFVRRTPPGEETERLVCTRCGFVHYENPRIIVGAVATWEGRILLCRRAIEPREGHWTVPAGFMEFDETAEAGARRETLEETGARIEVTDLLGLYSVPHIGQVHLIYRARLLSPELAPGPESHEARLFSEEEIPFEDLAFPTNRWALKHFLKVRYRRIVVPFHAPQLSLERETDQPPQER